MRGRDPPSRTTRPEPPADVGSLSSSLIPLSSPPMATSVILSAARTPVGSFGGALSTVSAQRALGSVPLSTGALDRAGLEGKDARGRGDPGQRGDGRGGAGARPPGRVGRRAAAVGRVHDHQQGVWQWHEGRHAGRPGDPSRRRRGRGRGPAVWRTCRRRRSTSPKARYGYGYGNGELIDGLFHDGLRDAYDGVAMGVAADAVRRDVQRPTRAPGRVHDRELHTCSGLDRGRDVRPGDRARSRCRAARATRSWSTDEEPAQDQVREDPERCGPCSPRTAR